MAKQNEDQQKLVDLFRNRAELKKEFITLRQERADLTERLEEQVRIGKRAEAELFALEDLLGNPVASLNALVFYHLRGLWKICHAQLFYQGRGHGVSTSPYSRRLEALRHTTRGRAWWSLGQEYDVQQVARILYGSSSQVSVRIGC